MASSRSPARQNTPSLIISTIVKQGLNTMPRVTTTSPTSPTATGAAEPAKVKRKGARSVSTLTPSQLARKRANDREAQRAIRARTKEHIERLERELEELKSQQTRTRDETVQDLLRRNKMLEEELVQLRRSSPMNQYYAPVFEDTLSVTPTSGTMPSPPRALTSSSGSGPQAFCGQPTTPNSATGPDYGVLTSNGTTDYGTPGSTSSPTFSVVPDSACDSWTAALIQHPTIPSNVSSPGSATPASAAGQDEFGRGSTFAGIDGMPCIRAAGPNDTLESFNDMDSGDVYPPVPKLSPSPTSHHHTVIAHPQPHHSSQPPYLHQQHAQGVHPPVAFGAHHAQANHGHTPWANLYPTMYYQNRSPVTQM